MGNVQRKGKADGLTNFQRKKLKYDFYTFFDLNKDGCLTYKDFLWAKDKICQMSGWKIDSPKYKITEALFAEIWNSLERIADVDRDGKITKAEWLMMWEAYEKEISLKEEENKDFLKKFYERNEQEVNLELYGEEEQDESDDGVETEDESVDANNDDFPVVLDSDEEGYVPPKKDTKDVSKEGKKKKKLLGKKDRSASEPRVAGPTLECPLQDGEQQPSLSTLEIYAADRTYYDNTILPKWLYKYLLFRFNLLDRCGDNIVDNEEFEYVLSEFGVSEKTARQAFTIFTKNNTVPLDFQYFVWLFEQYYLSDDPSDLGNFINGKLTFEEDDSGDEDEDPGLVDHKVKSSLSLDSMDDDLNPYSQFDNGSTIKLHEETKKKKSICQYLKEKCCQLN